MLPEKSRQDSHPLHGFLLTRKSIASIVAVSLTIGGCSTIQPQPLTKQEVASTIATDRASIQQEVEPLKGALSLEEAIARAIKYNLERRVRRMEEAVAMGQLEVGSFDMLPKLVASAGYRSRDNDLITRSKDSVTGAPSLANPYISSERSAATADLGFTWSLLDFGQSYYAAKQSANRVLIAEERRRKAIHILTQDVRTAFWRAAGAQKLKTDVQNTIAEAEDALKDSRKAEAERLRNPLDALRYQRQLLENLRLLEAIDHELSSARVELSSLISLPLSNEINIAEPQHELATRWLEIPVEKMEERALAQNADVLESFYNTRIASEEARRGLLKLFPGLSFNYAMHKSDDSYLINQRWNDAGVQLSMNLFGLLAAPAQQKLGETLETLAAQQRMAVLMNVLTQVHLSRLNLANAFHQYQRADAIWRVDLGISEHMAKREQAETNTKLDRIANQTSAILSQLRRYQAMALVHAATSKLQATLGMEPVIEGSQNMPLAQLTQAVAVSLQQWDEGLLQAKDGNGAASVPPPQTLNKPAPAPAAPISPPANPIQPASTGIENAVDKALHAWLTAWSSGNFAAYLEAYAPGFLPADGSSRATWINKRKHLVDHAKNIRIDIGELKTTTNGPQQAETRFIQAYQSPGFADTVQKTLKWELINGRWQIVQEVSATHVRQPMTP